jgi:hypothetical protein
MAPRYEKMVDLAWSDTGDFVLETAFTTESLGTVIGGDFLDTKRMGLRAWIQRVKARLGSSRKDWQYLPIGADLENFTGASNSEATAEAIKSRIINVLSEDNLVRVEEMRVEVIPLSQSHLGVIIAVRPPGARQPIMLPYSIGLRDTHLVPRET